MTLRPCRLRSTRPGIPRFPIPSSSLPTARFCTKILVPWTFSNCAEQADHGFQHVAVALIARIARGDALPAHHCGYSYDGSIESLPVKGIGLDYYLLPERHLINISFVYFRLDSPCGSVREAKQWPR